MANNKHVESLRAANSIRLQTAFAALIFIMSAVSFVFFCYFACKKEFVVAAMFAGGDFIIMKSGWNAIVSYLFDKTPAQ